MSTLLPLANTSSVVEEFSRFMASRMPNAALRYAVVFLGKGISRNASISIQKSSGILSAMGLLTNDNKIDVEAVHGLAIDTYNEVGKFELYGYSFDNVEIDALAEIARKYSTNNSSPTGLSEGRLS